MVMQPSCHANRSQTRHEFASTAFNIRVEVEAVPGQLEPDWTCWHMFDAVSPRQLKPVTTFSRLVPVTLKFAGEIRGTRLGTYVPRKNLTTETELSPCFLRFCTAHMHLQPTHPPTDRAPSQKPGRVPP